MRLLFGSLSGQGVGATLATLILHRVRPQPDPLMPGEPDARRFDAVCGWLARWFQVLPLDQAVQALHEGRLPARALGISFDDGYADNYEVALPILKRHGLTATFFVTTGAVERGGMWNDSVLEAFRQTRQAGLHGKAFGVSTLGHIPLKTIEHRREAVERVLAAIKYQEPAERTRIVAEIVRLCDAGTPANPMMSPAQIRGLRDAGMQLGAHTDTHAILARLDDEAARDEIERSRDKLQTWLGEPPRLFAYPNGKPGVDFDARHVELVRLAGFRAAWTTAPGVARATSDVFQLPRFTPWARSRWRFGLQLAANYRHREPAPSGS
jgi:peptidoglycan/xylan/chitin deacetylase (PgdA/CDA1 family)